MILVLFFYHAFLISITLVFLTIIRRARRDIAVWRSILLSFCYIFIIFLSGSLFPIDGFGRIQLIAWGVFLYFPIFLLGSSLILFHPHRTYTYVILFVILTILAVAVDAFLIEPNQLQISQITIPSSKLDRTYKVVFLADLQTDRPGKKEGKVLDLASDEEPDLILFGGDYLHIHDQEEYKSAVPVLNEIMVDSRIGSQFMVYAIQGNVDWNNWKEIFEETGIVVIDSTASHDIGPIKLTALSLGDSIDTNLVLQASNQFHLVVGHSPDYSLGEIDADLMLAGHTHGGQVQLPGIGPLLTLSAVPRKWASGLTEIQPGKLLLVSRGIGMERGLAPRMRFLCRPEIVVINLEPQG